MGCHCLLRFSHSVVSNSLSPHGLQHARYSCPSLSPEASWNSCPLNWWCHPTILSSVIPFLSCLQCFPELASFLMNQLYKTGGQSIGASVLVLVSPKKIQDWFPLGLTRFISLQSKGLSRVFSNTTIQKHHLWYHSVVDVDRITWTLIFFINYTCFYSLTSSYFFVTEHIFILILLFLFCIHLTKKRNILSLNYTSIVNIAWAITLR